MNVVNLFRGFAEQDPSKTALCFPHTGKRISRGELLHLSHRFALGLSTGGAARGDFALIFIKPGENYHALILALLQQGIIPVFIDPGMGKKNLLNCVREIKPKILIGENILFYLERFFRDDFKSIKIRISKTQTIFPWVHSLASLQKKGEPLPYQELASDETCAILYTSGGTGTPKGVEYNHQIFIQQVELLKEMFHLTENDSDMPGFPLFSMFTLCMGMSSSVPTINVAKPAAVNAKVLVSEILKMKPTFLAGSPAIWAKVGRYCCENKITLPSVKTVAMFGAPVSLRIHEDFKDVLINGTTYTPYGATECLPIANVSGKEILDGFYLKMRKGFGTCLGKVHLGMEVQIFSLNGDDTLGGGPSRPEQWGEICVTGPVMTKKYFKSELKTSQSKFIYQDKIWHRMGDLGYFDQNNNLWFGGRISHRLYVNEQMIAPIPVESLVNFEPQVNRSALVRGAQGPALVIETKHPRALSKKSLQNILQKNIFNIAVENIYTTAHFPVDVRHNIKIDRLQLRRDLMNGKLKEL